MWKLDVVGVVPGQALFRPLTDAVLAFAAGDGAQLRVLDPRGDIGIALDLTSGLAADAGALPPAARLALTVDGVEGSLSQAALAAAALCPASITAFLSPTAPVAGQGVILCAAGDMLAVARPLGAGLALFAMADTVLTPIATLADSDDRLLGQISCMTTAQIGGQTYLFAASGSETGITALRLGDNPQITAMIGIDRLPVQSITALRAVDLGGQPYLIAAAAGSSSLTVMRLGPDGQMLPVDQVIDDLPTRFQGVSAIEVAQLAGRTLVFAAGADDGITVFTLMPNGHLVYLSQIADSDGASLAHISALRAVAINGGISLFATSATEIGITQIAVDLQGLGVAITSDAAALVGSAQSDQITVTAPYGASVSAGAGDDIIADGSGADTLTGGAGADLFVMRADGARDVITDFDAALDRLDLTEWPFLRDASRLTFVQTATGCVISFFGEELELRSANGKFIKEQVIRALQIAPLTRISPTGTEAIPEWPQSRNDTPAGPASQNDTLAGGAGADRLEGGAGDDRLTGGRGIDTLLGGAGHDWLQGGDEADIYADGDGNDTLVGGAAPDRLIATAGDDSLQGQGGADTLDGGAGNDRLFGGSGIDHLTGGAGDDWLQGGDEADIYADGAGNDTLMGGAAADKIAATDGEDSLFGNGGADTLDGGAGNDQILGGSGNDLLYGGAGGDTLLGEGGSDRIYGGNSADSLDGGTGNDTLNGGAGNDSLWGCDGNDAFTGYSGDDFVFAGFGHDTLTSGDGNDRLWGESGNDSLVAGNGLDWLYGGDGDDGLNGGRGADRLWGDGGRDRLDGGRGNDTLTGGAGADRFTIDGFAKGEVDLITDYQDGTDRIALRGVSGASAAARFKALAISTRMIGDQDFAQITYHGHTILLANHSAHDLGAADFIFL